MNAEAPFHRIKIRVAALIFNGDEIALIKRVKNGTEQYTVPGGNVDPGEPLPAALARELKEELNLDVDQADAAPRFTWLLDAMVSRPGSTPPRKLHMVFRLSISDHVRGTLSATEHDDTAGVGELVWIRRQETKDLALFPPVPVADLTTPAVDLDAGAALLPELNDSNYRWI
ncbi:NUDIX domain-containing protein [Streptomyces sp. NPDC056361]|uniref:NUDIX domain-containing protein n=1 Tax=Streptomyces sp. NPDC056361 TaxID=3345795 RepID=UPI0035E3B971